jgi:hypothetical protein
MHPCWQRRIGVDALKRSDHRDGVIHPVRFLGTDSGDEVHIWGSQQSAHVNGAVREQAPEPSLVARRKSPRPAGGGTSYDR